MEGEGDIVQSIRKNLMTTMQKSKDKKNKIH